MYSFAYNTRTIYSEEEDYDFKNFLNNPRYWYRKAWLPKLEFNEISLWNYTSSNSLQNVNSKNIIILTIITCTSWSFNFVSNWQFKYVLSTPLERLGNYESKWCFHIYIFLSILIIIILRNRTIYKLCYIYYKKDSSWLNRLGLWSWARIYILYIVVFARPPSGYHIH